MDRETKTFFLDDIEELHTKLVDALSWSRIWKEVAKKWRYFGCMAIEDLESNGQRYYYRKWVDEKALAASRLELLKKCEWVDHYCPICGNSSFEKHADDCELAKELGDD